MRLRILYAITFITIMVMFCSAAHSWGVIEKGPYLQNVGKDRITIMWETLYEAKSRVDYGVTKDYDLFVENAKEVEIHEVTLRPLRPNTRYYYKISSGLTTKVGNFKTAPDRNIPFKFVVYGDSREDPDIHRDIAKNILKADPDLILHVGDMVNSGKKDYQWESQFFEPLRDVINHIPIYTALGNHEADAKNYFDLFSLPNNESWYFFNYSNCHFIVLDTNKEYKKGSNQYKWLRNDLEKANTKWKFAIFHHPPYGSGTHHESTLKARNVLTPLFRKHGVDMVFSGHHHIYERTYPIDSAFELGSSPVTYIITGGAGADLHKFDPKVWAASVKGTYNFCAVSIDGEKLSLKAMDDIGREIDKLSISKEKGKYQQYAKNAIYYEQMEFERNLLANITPPVVLLNEAQAPVQDAIKMKNTFPESVDVKITWHDLNKWDVEPREDSVKIDSGKIGQVSFIFSPPDVDKIWPPPKFSIAYDTGLASGKVTNNYLRVLSFKVLSCEKAGRSIDLDGRLREDFWENAVSADEFIRSDFSGLADKKTTVRVARGRNAIYISIVCKESDPDDLTATTKKRDGNIANDEAVIVSIAPHKGDKMVYQFGVNCDGVRYDAKGGIKEWNGKWESATRLNNNDWTVEMAIPYKVLELASAPEKDETWKVNFFRSTLEAPEKSEWSATLSSPLEVERLGALIMD
ncbi:metallophosphoesterase [Candidatus Poribacteria bacterium]